MIYPEVIKRIATELKAHDFDAIWVSSMTWNALKASTDKVERHEVEGDVKYAVPLITSGREIHVFCDPTLEDSEVTVATEEDDEPEETEET